MDDLAELERMASACSASGFNEEHAIYIHTIREPTYSVLTPRKTANPSHQVLLRLTTPLEIPWAVAEAAGMECLPPLRHGIGDEAGDVEFCILDALEQQKVAAWSKCYAPGFEPTFVMLTGGKAAKELDDMTARPTLGVDTTLPQFCASVAGLVRPSQIEYRVWYFFYGTLADPGKLAEVLETPGAKYELSQASVKREKLRTWGGGKYLAMIDAAESDEVTGWAFLVHDEAQEDKLRMYETHRYDVVRCEIAIEALGSVRGHAFRFARGFEGKLDPI